MEVSLLARINAAAIATCPLACHLVQTEIVDNDRCYEFGACYQAGESLPLDAYFIVTLFIVTHDLPSLWTRG